MAYVFFNPNPEHLDTGDCTVRAISRIMKWSWEETYAKLCLHGSMLHMMPSTNAVWDDLLQTYGYERYPIPNTCPRCYTIKQFCKDNPHGVFILATGTHVVAVVEGDYYDAWDSGDNVPVYFYMKRSK